MRPDGSSKISPRASVTPDNLAHAPSSSASEDGVLTANEVTRAPVEKSEIVNSSEGGREEIEADGCLRKSRTDEEDVKDSEVVGDAAMSELKTHHSNGLVDQTAYLPPKQIIVVFLALTLVIFLSFLDQTIVSTALPNISAAFNAGRNASWVASAYLLTSTAFQPVWGRLSDVFGRKYTLLACVTFFTIGSLACAVAQSMTQLIVFRGLQGVGGGGLLTLVLIIVSDIVSLKERGKYQGINEITIAIANGVGPLLGGVLSEKAGWRWCFWINLPVAAVTLTVIVFFLPLKRVDGDIKKKLLQIDYVGSLLVIVAAGLIIFPLNWGGISFPWVSGQVLGCLIGGVALFGVLMLYEWKFAVIPIVPPSLFKSSTVNGVMLCTFIAGMVILSQLYYIPQYLQIVRGVSAIRSGVLVLPLLILVTVSVFSAGQLLARTGEYKINIILGYAVWSVGLGLFSTLDQHTSTAKLIGFMVVGAIGQGQTLQTTMVAAQAAVNRSEMSVVTSVRNFLRSLGGALALALAAAIINNTLRSELIKLPGFPSTLIDSIIDDSTGIWRPSATSGSELYDLSAEQKADIISAFVKGFHTMFRGTVVLVVHPRMIYTDLLEISPSVLMDSLAAVFLIKRISLSRADEAALKDKGKAWVEHRKQKGTKDADLERNEAAEEEKERASSDRGTMVEVDVRKEVAPVPEKQPAEVVV
ncbi:hypothetical protein P7C70_g5223, partial [Phenoliferia sp. Uapishka_3]